MHGSPPASGPDFELHLLRDTPPLERPPVRRAAVGSFLAHLAMLAGWFLIPATEAPRIRASSEPSYRVTPLIMPPELVRKGPTRDPSPARDVSLDSLLTQQQRNQPLMPVPAPAPARPATPSPSPVPAPPPPKVIDAPKIDIRHPEPVEVARNLPPGLGSPTDAQIKPPPTPPPAPKPKIAFETPGGSMGSSSGGSSTAARIPVPPKSGVDEAARAVARQSSRGGLMVGDAVLGGGSLGEALANPLATPKNLSALEMLNDPQGIDFKPYLIRILSTVKRNWQAVIPESARMGGRRGKVLIQFAINRDGSVPKLVIASPSGADPLDRAAVAGISASNPFPPLPPEFQGPQIRLQFTFVYNQPTQ